MTTLARLKPFDGKRFVRRSYTSFGIKFIGDRGWYKVDNDVAEYLKTVTQRAEDPDSAPAFDVCSPEEARAIDERERVKANRRDAEQAESTQPAMRVHNVARPAAANAARAALAVAHDLSTDDIGHTPSASLDEILGPADAAPGLSGDFDDDMAEQPAEPVFHTPSSAASLAPAPSAPSHHNTKKSHHKGGGGGGGKKPPELL